MQLTSGVAIFERHYQLAPLIYIWLSWRCELAVSLTVIMLAVDINYIVSNEVNYSMHASGSGSVAWWDSGENYSRNPHPPRLALISRTGTWMASEVLRHHQPVCPNLVVLLGTRWSAVGTLTDNYFRIKIRATRIYIST